MSDNLNARIHPSSVIDEGAVIDPSVSIGPFCYVGSEVILQKGVVLKSHVVLSGLTEVGEDTVIFPFASIGHIPQDLKFNGERTKLKIGKSIATKITLMKKQKKNTQTTILLQSI